MLPVSKILRLTATAAVAGWAFAAAGQASAAEMLRLGRESAFMPAPANVARQGSFTVAGKPLMVSSYTSMISAKAFDSAPMSPRFNGLSANGLLRGFDLAGSTTSSATITAPSSLQLGMFGGMQERQSILALVPASSWNIGGSIGYSGFYLRGGMSEHAPIGPLLGLQGMQAGFGYETGAVDVRFTYLSSQATGGGSAERELDNKQWMIGGIYQISRSIRLNADAFYGPGDTRGTALSVMPSPTSPPGTGARVGVQLRF